MCMMPCAVSCASVSMHIVDVSGARGAGVRNCGLVGAQRTVQNHI